MRFLNTILLVLILLAVCAGGALLYFGKLSVPSVAQPIAHTDTSTPPVVSRPIFLALDPFTVTLQDPQQSQILYLEISVRVPDQQTRDYLLEYMPEVRNRILTELSRHSASRVQQTEGRQALAENLRQMIGAPYPPRPDGPEVVSVLFTAFVVQ